MTPTATLRSRIPKPVISRVGVPARSNETAFASLSQVSEGSVYVRGGRRPEWRDQASEVGVGDVDHG